MKFYTIILLSLFTTSCNMEEISQNTHTNIEIPQKMSIGFYNVENLFDTKDEPGVNDNDFTPEGYKAWTTERYYKKIASISKVINAMNTEEWPVLVGLAEVENKTVLEDLIQEEKLRDANYKIVHFDSPDERGIDVALLYRESYFNIINKESIPINNPAFPNSKTRDILYVEAYLLNEVKVHFFVNHWSSRRDGTLETEPKRVFQAKKLRARVDKIRAENANAKIIIMGDFNDYPTNKSIKKTLRAGVGNSELYNLAYALHMDDKGTINYKNDWGMFDQFIVSQSMFTGSVYLETKQQNILDKDWLIWKGKKPNRTYGGNTYYGGFSDHLPVYIDLKIN